MSFRDLAVFAVVWSYAPDEGGIPILTAAYALVPTLSFPQRARASILSSSGLCALQRGHS